MPVAGRVHSAVAMGTSCPSASQANPTSTTSATSTAGHSWAGRSFAGRLAGERLAGERLPGERLALDRADGRRRAEGRFRDPVEGRRVTVRAGLITVDCRTGCRRRRAPEAVEPGTGRCSRRSPVVTVDRRPRHTREREDRPMPDHLLPGITATLVETPRLTQQVLAPEGTDVSGPGEVVLFVHGNVSSSLFWQQPLLALAGTGRVRALAVDLRGYGGTEPLPIDARRGMRDWADDVAALVETLGLDRVASGALVAPVSPYGFGGTAGAEGRAVHDDGCGSGAGGANPDFVAAVSAGDTTADSPTSPRSILRTFYVAPGSLPLDPQLEDVFVASMNTTRCGEDHFLSDAATTETWPGVAPGGRGVLNTMSPTVCRLDGIVDLDEKPPVLWLRGDADQIVSDTSAFDLAFLGSVGALPGWPGAEAFPPQPMVTQTRAVLDRYAASGGAYREVVFPEVGHSPHVERPQEFVVALLEHLDVPAEQPANLT